MTEPEILTTAIRTFGEKAQEDVAIEECAELIQAISHKHRGREHNIAEEIADVEIMLEQLKIINNCAEEVAAIHKQKIERLFNSVFDMCL
jgi:NTP pyrophosphatase (non-canonical NTP hydrolase)